ncbi:MAG TPA: TetR/AcrR family transcriptional regulator [Longimicrobiaceae bacterium]|nr:TetR/AcrR family transcriptional regulator [Longimicrobiaceae bacterium]
MTEPPATSQREARRREILDSAVREFADHGFFAARISDIAAGAGVAEGTIYLYFPSKDDLLLTAFRERVNEFCDSVRDVLRAEAPFPERLASFIRMQFESIEAQPALATVLLLESRQSSKFYGGAVRDVLRAYSGAIDQLLESGRVQGMIRDEVDIPLARRMLIGALEEIELAWLLGDHSRPLVPSAPQVAATFFRGLARG